MTNTTPENPHPLDHLVLPTASLNVARARLTALGFVVAPIGVHPFGTENCCVFFADGTYLEPLAIGDERTAASAVGQGNVFVARDRIYRDKRGNEGFSAVVVGTDNADKDHASFVEAGLSAGDVLSFSRAFTDATGKSDTASFKLAFASGSGASDAFLFACERLNTPRMDRTALQAHPNDVTGIVEVVAVSDMPFEQRGLFSLIASIEDDGGTAFGFSNATLTALDPASFASRFGIAAGAPTELRFAGIVFSVRSAKVVAELLAANSIEHDIRANDIIVAPAPGQGAAFIFREIA